jgi:hypothetical protein
MSQFILKQTAEPGQLFSITDVAPMHPRGQKAVITKNGYVAEYEYLYNAIGADAVQGVFYLKNRGAKALSPSVDGFTVTNNEVGEIAIAQAAIPSTRWGWYLTKGHTNVSGVKMYWDGVDQNGTDTCTDGYSFTIANGIAACDDAALWGTYPTDVPLTPAGVCAETITAAATTVHVELLGGVIKCAT